MPVIPRMVLVPALTLCALGGLAAWWVLNAPPPRSDPSPDPVLHPAPPPASWVAPDLPDPIERTLRAVA